MIGGTLPGKVSFEKSKYATLGKDGIYTVRFDVDNPSAMGERCDDAKNLGFNAAVSQGTIALGENHFDKIYPWKDIKLCNIKDGEVVCYEGEEGFSATGENGDVFVEIPKFYVRRVSDGSYDSISVSGVCHEGFVVDEAFVKENGEEADCIYVAAYLTSINDKGEAVSVAESNIVLDYSPMQLEEAATKKGYKELDYHALAALQRLFMVETGLRNSQYLYLGTCGYTMADKNKESSDFALAMTDNVRTNCIVVDSTYNFESGNSVIIFNTDDYEKSLNRARKDVRGVKTVIENSNNTQSVYITGEPIDVMAGKTAIAHTALANGTTRSVVGHTGAISTARGTVAFKYRNMENFWGNAFVYIDSVTAQNRKVTIEKRNGKKVELGYMLPETHSSNAVNNMIRSIGYDSSNPLVMLPDKIGDGATISTYFGDAYIPTAEADEKVLHYGGGWNSRACAGLFNFAASSAVDEVHTNTSGRMMYIK